MKWVKKTEKEAKQHRHNQILANRGNALKTLKSTDFATKPVDKMTPKEKDQLLEVIRVLVLPIEED